MSKRRWKKRGACATISFALVCLICLDGVRAQSSSPSLSSPVFNTLTKEAATNAPENVVDEIVEDDPLGHAEVTRKELNEVLRKARTLVKKSKIVTGESAEEARQIASQQADAGALIAANEAAVADAYDVASVTAPRPFARKIPDDGRVRFVNAGKGGATVKGSALTSEDARFQLLSASSTRDKTNQEWAGVLNGAVQEQTTQQLEHNLQHEFLSENSADGKKGTGFTGVSDGPVWHADWTASATKNIKSTKPKSECVDVSCFDLKTQDVASVARKESNIPPGIGMRGIPSGAAASSKESNPSDGNAKSAVNGCMPEQITLCKAGCVSRGNLEMGSDQSADRTCVSKCLGPCSTALGFDAPNAQTIAQQIKKEENLLNEFTKDLVSASKSTSHAAVNKDEKQNPLADDIVKQSIKNLQMRAGSQSSSTSGANGIWHGDTSSRDGSTNAVGDGVKPFPAMASKSGEQTGVYDCRGQAIVVGSVLGKIVPGQPCEDRFLIATAGMWVVKGFGQPSADKLIQSSQNDGQSRVEINLKGVSADSNGGIKVQIFPRIGVFASWKIIQGSAGDIYLPANLAALVAAGKTNVAGVHDQSQFSEKLKKMKRPSSDGTKQASGSTKTESMIVDRQKADWSKTGVFESEDTKLNMCPGPSCPTDGRVSRVHLMKMSSPFWKYVIASALVGFILSARYIWKHREAIAESSKPNEYVELPDIWGRFSTTEAEDVNKRGGARPCPGMTANERVIMVENASDRIIMVDIGETSSNQPEDAKSSTKERGYQ
mmetsp:Transcript_27257/g.89017  ORF Transcript_27257/g.89017 Transcript_27257/m.89017 type:complete len:776 (+) Transcript_27257:63-2390(+)